jgi:hypothetical protein
MSGDTERYAIRQWEDVTIVRLKISDLTNIVEVRRLSQDLLGLVDNGAVNMILDLKYARHFGRRINLKDGKLVISHPEHILPVLQVTKIGRLFETAPDPKAAAKLFPKPP